MNLSLIKHVSPNLDDGDAEFEAEWLRSAYIDRNDEVFVPAALLSDCEQSVLENVEVDGVAFVDEGHLYVQVTWAKNVYPTRFQALVVIEKSVRKVHQIKKNLRAREIKTKFDVQ